MKRHIIVPIFATILLMLGAFAWAEDQDRVQAQDQVQAYGIQLMTARRAQ